ncbi:MAG: DUF4365 domain-containing protein, partial [Roseimicrobium sp.]
FISQSLIDAINLADACRQEAAKPDLAPQARRARLESRRPNQAQHPPRPDRRLANQDRRRPRRLYLQLKSGNSHLTKRKTDGAEIFTIKKQRWVEYWLQQPHPVMPVIGTFSEDDERAIGKDKLEFAEVRWMEISSVLQRESANGTKPEKQIEFKGERLDLSSVRRWRERILRGM